MAEDVMLRELIFQDISNWIIESALKEVESCDQFLEFCQRLSDAGIPLLRGHLATRALHPLFVSGTSTWERNGYTDISQIRTEDADGEDWKQSPLYDFLQSGDLECRHKFDTSDGWKKYPMLVDLAARGASDYFAQIVMFGSVEKSKVRQDGCVFSWTCSDPNGFSDEQITVLRWLSSRFGVIAKLDSREKTANNVAAAYLGAEAGQRVLDGQIKLGDGEIIPAVIWYCDLRDSTTMADQMSGEEFIEDLNSYFQCTAGSVLDHGGEVLRFVGDAVLAIFHVDGVDGYTRAARVALAAARDAERRLQELNHQRTEHGKKELQFGLALHSGDLMFGNIGVPERVEFSVIGPAANEVARIEGLTKTLGHRILVSKTFADLLSLQWNNLGPQQVAGVDEPIYVFAP